MTWRASVPLALAASFVATGASAFDCGKASTASEKAICADPAALAADAAMAKAYSNLLASVPPAERAAIVSGQARWPSTRDWRCDEAKGAALGACLARESDRRRAFLEGRAESGPGASSRVVPWFRFEKRGKGRAGIDLELLKFLDPSTAAERAFNAGVEKFTENLEQPGKGDPTPDRYEYDRDLRLVYASPRLLSALVTAFEDTGGAHPNSFTGNINIDVAAGRAAKFEDLVDPAGAEKIFAICLQTVREQKKEKLGDNAPMSVDDLAELTKQVKEATRNLGAWSFSADAATVIYDPYAVGSYAEGAYECKLPYSTLRGFAKPGFPLPT